VHGGERPARELFSEPPKGTPDTACREVGRFELGGASQQHDVLEGEAVASGVPGHIQQPGPSQTPHLGGRHTEKLGDFARAVHVGLESAAGLPLRRLPGGGRSTLRRLSWLRSLVLLGAGIDTGPQRRHQVDHLDLARYTYEGSRTLGHLLAQIIVRELPAIATVQRNIDARQGKVYLDYLQNRRGQLIVAPYSVRPLSGAPVSAPLRWREVRKGLEIGRHTIRTLPRRLARMKDDPVRPVLEMSPDLADVLGRLQEMVETNS